MASGWVENSVSLVFHAPSFLLLFFFWLVPSTPRNQFPSSLLNLLQVVVGVSPWQAMSETPLFCCCGQKLGEKDIAGKGACLHWETVAHKHKNAWLCAVVEKRWCGLYVVGGLKQKKAVTAVFNLETGKMKKEIKSLI